MKAQGRTKRRERERRASEGRPGLKRHLAEPSIRHVIGCIFQVEWSPDFDPNSESCSLLYPSSIYTDLFTSTIALRGFAFAA